MPRTSKKGNRAFTLIELLAVLAIMTIIAGLLTAGAVGLRRKADRDAAAAGVTLISSKIESYFNKRDQLPPNLNPGSGAGQDDFTDEVEIYRTLSEWGFGVLDKQRVDPWGNPYVIIFLDDYEVNFPLQSGGACYTTPPFDRMYGMFVPPPAAPDDRKELRVGDPIIDPTTDTHNSQADGFQVISAGPDGKLSRDGTNLDVNGDNLTNW